MTVACIIGLSAFIDERGERAKFTQKQRDEISSVASSLKDGFSTALNRKLVLASGMAGAISLSPDIDQTQFSRLGTRVFREDPAVLNLSTIRDFKITHVHPVEKSAQLLGRDLSESPERVRSLERVRDSGKSEIQGPIQLYSGFTGFIIRQPIFIDHLTEQQVDDQRPGKFWGMISLVFKADALFEEVNLPELSANYDIAVIGRASALEKPMAIYGDQTLFEGDAITSFVPVPNGSWEIAVAPANGWITNPPGIIYRRVAYLFLAISAVFFTHFFLSMRDIKARIAQQLRGAVEVLPDGFVIYDDRDRLVICNSKYKEFYSKSAAAIYPGNSFEGILRYGLAQGQYPEAAGREDAWLAERLEAHFAEQAYVEQRLEDGRWIRVIEKATPDGGRAGVRLDITAQKEYEANLEKTNASLEAALKARDEAEARFAELSDISTEWYWEQDEELRFTYFSEGFARANGFDPTSLLGTRRHDIADMDPSLSEDNGISRIIRATEARETFHDLFYRADNVREEEMWVRTSGKPFYDSEGKFLGYRGTAADVTPLYTALREAKMANRAKTQFLNVISHELRTPLTVLLGFNRFLTKPEILPAFKRLHTAIEASDHDNLTTAIEEAQSEVATYAQKMDVAGKQLLALISDMLDLARIESNTVHIEKERVEALPKIETAIEQLTPLAKNKNLILRNKASNHILHADTNRLRQILNNLIGNAIKFTNSGEITISSEERDGMAYFHVEDTGIGISEDMLPLIFERFHQVESDLTRTISGVGLGLTITRELITLQGGKISVKSTPGKGSCFTFSIPLWTSDT